MIALLSSKLGPLVKLAHLLGQRPQSLAFLPALVLASFWLGGELLLLVTALGLPILLAMTDHRPITAAASGDKKFEDILSDALKIARRKAMKTACLIIEIDGQGQLLNRFGASAMNGIMAQTQSRIRRNIRMPDKIVMLKDGRIAVILAPTRNLGHDIVLKLAARLQSAIEDPLTIDATNAYITASVGICLNDALRRPTAEDFADATNLALNDAKRNAPSGLRAYAPNLSGLATCPKILRTELETALEKEQFKAWFQPQISTETGRVTGFEALVRWEHPSKGMIAPADFLPDLVKTGDMERLGEQVLAQALKALKGWDEAGISVPRIGVNFAPDELRNPRLVDRVAWALDKFDLPANRLSVEILETVVSTSSDDTISSNIRRLGKLGCHIDLDDFGTGHASISSIRRFAVNRLKIDRSFVMKVDRDSEQKDMIAAILLMAERLGLDTLAEGVETAGEHAMLAQLGCAHVQGFGIARPMPFERTIEWVTTHNAKLQEPPIIGRKIV